MKKLIIVGIAVILLLLSKTITPGPVRWTMLAVSLVLSMSVLIHGVILRRRRGESWNQALAGGTKLMTGSVWLDGALFAVILIGIYAVLRFLVFRP